MDSYQKRRILEHLRLSIGDAKYYQLVNQYGEDQLIEAATRQVNAAQTKVKSKSDNSAWKWILFIAAIIHGVVVLSHLDPKNLLDAYHYVIGFITIPFGMFGFAYVFGGEFLSNIFSPLDHDDANALWIFPLRFLIVVAFIVFVIIFWVKCATMLGHC